MHCYPALAFCASLQLFSVSRCVTLTLMVSSKALRKSMGLPAGHACDNPGLSALAHSCALLAVSQARASVTGSSILVLQPACSPEVMQPPGNDAWALASAC